MDPQHKSTALRSVEQLSLLPARKASPQPDVAYLMGLTSLRRAIRYSMSIADLEPKQVYGPLEKDKATWSRIESGDMSFPADDLPKLCQVIGNDAAVLWLAHATGFDLASMRKLQDDKDRRIADLEQQLAEERAEKAAIAKFVRETMR